MRAFVRLRRMLASHAELARKLDDLERKYDAQFKAVFDAIRQLMTPQETRDVGPSVFGWGKRRPEIEGTEHGVSLALNRDIFPRPEWAESFALRHLFLFNAYPNLRPARAKHSSFLLCVPCVPVVKIVFCSPWATIGSSPLLHPKGPERFCFMLHRPSSLVHRPSFWVAATPRCDLRVRGEHHCMEVLEVPKIDLVISLLFDV